MSLPKFLSGICMFLFAAGCGGNDTSAADSGQEHGGSEQGGVLRLAVTTSTRDSGLLDVLLPPFERQHGVRIDVIAVGTGAALQQGRDGNVDAVIVHSRPDEDAFLDAGHGVRRESLMSNQFEILGPPNDPAEIAGLDPAEALMRIATAGQRFVSRGDKSGTHARELLLWRARKDSPFVDGGGWGSYIESGQGMGATLTMANQMQAYTLSDRSTYLKRADSVELIPLTAASPAMLNPYGVLAVNPAKHASIRGALSNELIDYLISPSAQHLVATYEVGGEILFEPAHAIE